MKQLTAPKHDHARPQLASPLRDHVMSHMIANPADDRVGRRGITPATWRLATCTDVFVTTSTVAKAFAPYHQRPKDFAP